MSETKTPRFPLVLFVFWLAAVVMALLNVTGTTEIHWSIVFSPIWVPYSLSMLAHLMLRINWDT